MEKIKSAEEFMELNFEAIFRDCFDVFIGINNLFEGENDIDKIKKRILELEIKNFEEEIKEYYNDDNAKKVLEKFDQFFPTFIERYNALIEKIKNKNLNKKEIKGIIDESNTLYAEIKKFL